MPAAKDKPEAAGEEAPAVKAEPEKKYVANGDFHGYIETQLVKFTDGQPLDKNVSDWLLSHNGESHVREA